MKQSKLHLTDHELEYLKLEVRSTRQMGFLSIYIFILLMLCLAEITCQNVDMYIVFLPIELMLLIFTWIAYRKLVCFRLTSDPKVMILNGVLSIKHIGRKTRSTYYYIDHYRVTLPIDWSNCFANNHAVRAKVVDIDREHYVVLRINNYSIDAEAKHGLLEIKKPWAGMALLCNGIFYFFLFLLYKGFIFNKILLWSTLISLALTIEMIHHNRPYKAQLEKFRSSL